ncbi:replication initiation factor [Streptococcus suis]|uniref:Replication initiation factor n=1 Tax=Streptococcus suis TaxID=1307 RepID=A0A0Z8H928_STRSU|nr:replication initiator protein A [Streptococcus suis]NQH36327.1 replication initiation factor [Streptococcus suis]NQN11236.1 replication initiation factor [Streptococcus suis]CYV12746.1 replication initiation factor [Streptococcus suis]HEL1626071.1 replication initiator protein A [Streptococcus suis]HEM3213537.1 replication initiator protein A [Streptococcus suis 12814]
MDDMELDYYTVPKVLWLDTQYSHLSLEDMLIYAVLKDHVSRSIERGWIDETGAVYLDYSLPYLSKLFGISRTKMREVMARLEECDLIEREMVYDIRLRQYRTYVVEL